MFMVKIFNKKKDRDEEFNKTIKNIVNYICDSLSFNKAKVTSDSECVEVVSGNTEIPIGNDEEIVAELLMKKTLIINKSDFNDQEELDKFMTSIKNFCKQAKEIENAKYYRVHLRD